MKKLLCFIGLLIMSVTLLFSQKYVYSCVSVSGAEYYVYTNIIKINNNGIYQIWVKVAYTGESKNETIEHIKNYRNDGITDEQIENLYYSESVYLIDIKRNRNKLLSTSYKNLSGDILKSLSYDDDDTNWDYIYPDSVFDGVLKTIKSLLKDL